MKTMLRLNHCLCLGLIAVIGLLPARIAAQTVPALVNYQGRLANPDGTALVTGDYTLTFRVYDSATNSTGLVWGPQAFDGLAGQGHGSKIPVVQGYFNVMLGPVDTNGVSLDTAFNATNRYVEIRVGTNSPILPRQQILSAPYALQAGNSAKLAGSDWSAVFGTNDPVNGKIPTSKLATNGVIAVQSLGIGATNANNALVIHRALGGNDPSALQHNMQLQIENGLGSSASRSLAIGLLDNGNGVLQAKELNVGYHDLLLNPVNGNVGIGTASPGYKLDVAGEIRGSGWLRNSGTAGWINESYGGGWFMSDTTWVRSYNNKGVAIGGGLFNSDGGLTLGFSGTTPPTGGAIIGGSVGIGTTSPGYKLNVRVSGSSTDGLMTSGSDSRFVGLFPSLTGASYNTLVAGGDCAMIFSQGTAETGNLVIGPYSANAKGIKIMSDGSVGIGTGSPQAKLDVAGDIKTTASLLAGSMELTSVTPNIDFHFNNSVQDYNIRIINDADKTLDITAPGGNAILNVTGVIKANGVPLTSDRNAKTSFVSLNLQDVLSRVVAIPITEWEFKSTPEERHIGPMAQDFKAAFNLGNDDKHINVVDSIGVSLAAIQGLNQKLEEQIKAKDAEIEMLKAKTARIESLEKRLADLERRTQTQKERN